MKTLKLIVALVMFNLVASAQNADVEKSLKTGLSILDTAKTLKGYLATKTYFEKLADDNKNEWLAQYYAGYANTVLGIKSKEDEEARDEIFEKALKYASKADVINSGNSEVYVLKGYITFVKMAVYPTERAMEMIPQANQLLEKALVLNPANPRAYFLKGLVAFYTPEMFGGGKTEAKKILLTAKEKFEKFEAKPLEPNWGKVKCAELLSQY